VGIVFYMVTAFVVQRSKSRARGLVEYLAMAPVALPPIVLSVGFLLAWIDSPLPLYGTLAILVLAYVVRIMPTGFGTIFSSLGQVHPDLEDAAVMSGSSRRRAAFEITLPIIRSSTIAALIMIVILSFRELSIALFLFTSDTRILSIVIINYTEDGRTAAAAGASLVYCTALAALVFVTRRWLSVARVGD
jgi:iron(III) transport system permease protein